MKYILLNGNSVSEIIPGEDPVFPGIPIEKRYTPDFIARLLPVPDDTEVEQNWVYDPEPGTFAAPAAPEPIAEPTSDGDPTSEQISKG